MKIAFFTNNYKPFVGGVPIAIEKLSGRLRTRGHRVFIFAPEYHEPVEAEPDVFRIWSIKNFNDTSFSIPLPLSLEPYTRFHELNVDLVHVHHPFLLGHTGMRVGRSHNLPVVFTYHTQYEKYSHYMPFDRAMVNELAVTISTRFANCCDAVIAPSRDMERILRERGVTAPMRVIPTGVDLQAFRRGNARRFRERFGIAAGKKVALFVSRLAKEKNVSFVVDAFERIARERNDVRLVLAGSGEEEAFLRKRVAGHGLEDKVIFTGMLRGEDLTSAYKAADVFVFASTTETQGMVVLEAMAAGLPVVAVDAAGVRDIVVNGVNGCLAPEGDLEGFIENVLRVLGDESLRETLRQGALAQARQLSLASTTRKVEELYKSVLRSSHIGPDERFIMLREFFRYQFDRFTQELDDLLP
jgi:1,2-diacylglycerol 3-alpha-glucosyltransferase